MPFDATATTVVLPLDSDERWSVNRNAIPQPRVGFHPVSDTLALYLVWIGLRGGWAKRYNDGNNHCVVGWVGDKCEPMTIGKAGESEQSQRLLKRLHDALPRYAQRPSKNPAWVLAKYNDTHGQAAIVRVAERAYNASLIDMAGERKERAASR